MSFLFLQKYQKYFFPFQATSYNFKYNFSNYKGCMMETFSLCHLIITFLITSYLVNKQGLEVYLSIFSHKAVASSRNTLRGYKFYAGENYIYSYNNHIESITDGNSFHSGNEIIGIFSGTVLRTWRSEECLFLQTQSLLNFLSSYLDADSSSLKCVHLRRHFFIDYRLNPLKLDVAISKDLKFQQVLTFLH